MLAGEPLLEADLVLEGGGVRGIALAGAVAELAGRGYTFPRIAGSSAGAITGAIVAALVQTGRSVQELTEIALTMDFSKFRDPGTFGRHLGWTGDGVDMLLHDGLFRGDFLEDWLAGVLADMGVRTFGDLRLPPDPGGDIPEGHRYRLVVTASDLSRRKLTLLPWDFQPIYGLDPDEQSVARAVRASAAIPFFFRPVRLASAAAGEVTLVDGGLLSDFPIAVFDRTDGRAPRWPTFGVALDAGLKSATPTPHRVGGPLSLAAATIETFLNAQDSLSGTSRCDATRTMTAAVAGISSLDFGLNDAEKTRPWVSGGSAATEFLAGWDWSRYLRDCRGAVP